MHEFVRKKTLFEFFSIESKTKTKCELRFENHKSFVCSLVFLSYFVSECPNKVVLGGRVTAFLKAGRVILYLPVKHVHEKKEDM